jgi:hypothetical protein
MRRPEAELLKNRADLEYPALVWSGVGAAAFVTRRDPVIY